MIRRKYLQIIIKDFYAEFIKTQNYKTKIHLNKWTKRKMEQILHQRRYMKWKINS